MYVLYEHALLHPFPARLAKSRRGRSTQHARESRLPVLWPFRGNLRARAAGRVHAAGCQWPQAAKASIWAGRKQRACGARKLGVRAALAGHLSRCWHTVTLASGPRERRLRIQAAGACVRAYVLAGRKDQRTASDRGAYGQERGGEAALDRSRAAGPERGEWVHGDLQRLGVVWGPRSAHCPPRPARREEAAAGARSRLRVQRWSILVSSASRSRCVWGSDGYN